MNRRTVLGLISLLFLLTAAGLTWGMGWREASNDVFVGVLLRVGLVTGAAWLAYDQIKSALSKSSWKPWAIGGLLILLLAIRRDLALIVIGVLIVAGVVHWVLRIASFNRPTPKN